MAAKEREVEITLKTIGPSRPAKLRVPSSIKVHDLRRLVAADGHLPEERLKLVLRGKILLDKKNSYGDDATVGLENGDSLVVAVMPKPPPKHFHEDDYEDDDDLRFQIPQSTSWWKRRVFCFLHEKMKLPGMGLYHSMVFIGTCCSQMVFRTLIHTWDRLFDHSSKSW